MNGTEKEHSARGAEEWTTKMTMGAMHRNNEGEEEEEEKKSTVSSVTSFGMAKALGSRACMQKDVRDLTPEDVEEVREVLEDRVKGSPFIDLEHPVTVYEAVKMVVMGPVVVVKLLVALIVVFLAWMLLKVTMKGHTLGTPLEPWRYKRVAAMVGIGSRILMFLSGYYWIDIKGKENLKKAKEQRSILVYNHVSYTDPLLLLVLYQASGVAKSGVAEIPMIGDFAVALQFLFVARRGSADTVNRYTVKLDPQAAVNDRCNDHRFPLLFMAPEATTKPMDCLLKFRRGAFVPGRPVTPVLFRYHSRHFHPGWGAVNTYFHFWRLMSQFVNFVSIECLPPYMPSEDEKKDPALYAQHVREHMAHKLGMPMVEKGLDEEYVFRKYGVQTDLLGKRVEFYNVPAIMARKTA